MAVGVIQKSDRHMKISVGDVLTYGRPPELLYRTYFSHTMNNYIGERLHSTFNRATVYALIFENVTLSIAHELHEGLTNDEAYIGYTEVDYSYGPHLALFRNSMILRYRVQGKTCRIFYTMGEEDEKDRFELQSLQNLGFSDVDWEDKGAHKTIFDDYDTIEHFTQVESFKRMFSPYLEGGADGSSELAMILEDLNPKLFNVLGAAVAALERARHEEDVAQVAISGRRYLEKLADVLFPPSDISYKGKKVGSGQYKNRIWAYVDSNVEDADNLKVIGLQVDRLVEEFNAGLHSDRDRNQMLSTLVQLASLTAILLSLNPSEARKPYYAFEERILEFMKDDFDLDVNKDLQ